MKKVLFGLVGLLILIIFFVPNYEENPEVNDMPKVKYYEVIISGEIKNPGIKRVPERTLVKDIIELSGLLPTSVYLLEEEYVISDMEIIIYKRVNEIDLNEADAKLLDDIENIGEVTVEKIIKEREKRPFISWGDFKKRVDVNKKILLALMCNTIIR